MNPAKFWMVQPMFNIYFSHCDLSELLVLYARAIKHEHYCPCECHCFDRVPIVYDSGDVWDFILQNYSHNDTQERGM